MSQAEEASPEGGVRRDWLLLAGATVAFGFGFGINTGTVPNFSAGGVATPADASLMRQLGAQAVFVGSGIFKSENPDRVARAIVKATTHWDNPEILAEVSTGLGEPMHGLELSEIPAEERLAVRGW